MSEPLISVVIPCYNHGQYIDEAIKSVEESKYQDFEIIIINDGSTDDMTNKRLKELTDDGYNVIFQKNQGLGRTRNNGIRIAKGRYILPLDADNMIKPEFISKAIDIFNADPEVSVVYSDKQFFGDRNDILKVGEFNLPVMLRGNEIDACAIYRKSVWNEIGGYDEILRGLEDWDFWLSAAEKGFRFFYIPEPLFYYRVLENSMWGLILKNPDLHNSLVEYIYRKHVLLILMENERLRNQIHKAKHPFRTARKYLKKVTINRYLAFTGELAFNNDPPIDQIYINE